MVTKIERCILTDRIDGLNSSFDRIYFGTDYCDKLLKGIDTYRKLKTAKNLTLVLPPISEGKMGKAKEILKIFPRVEVVFNDFGILQLIKKNGHVPVLGRFLSKQQTDPRVVLLNGKIPKKAYEYFRKIHIDNIYTKGFLAEKGINRVEVSNALQGIANESKEISLSLYYPIVPISLTRACIAHGCETLSMRKRISFGDCSLECQRHQFVMDRYNKPIFLKGVLQYYLNGELPPAEEMKKNNIDRTVLVDYS